MASPLLLSLLLLSLSPTLSDPHLPRKLLSSPSPRRPLIWVAGILGGAAAGVLTGLLFSLLIRLVLLKYKKYHFIPTHPFSIFSPLIKPKDIDFLTKDDSLSLSSLIGRGASGEVFLSHLPSGQSLAVKRIPLNSPSNLSEITTWGYARHKNILSPLAYVTTRDTHLLVYDYMKNGTLRGALKELDWPARRNIAQGIASGLEYLHLEHKPKIIHRDLKPENILLDDNMEARISDFGLATGVPDSATHRSTSKVAGTIGYIAPEYHQTLRYTEKCDIYSLGVVLGVLVMGKMPWDEFFDVGIVMWLREAFKEGREGEVVDERLRGKGGEEEMALVIKVALLCTVDDPRQRPDSREVCFMLDQITRPRVSSSYD